MHGTGGERGEGDPPAPAPREHPTRGTSQPRRRSGLPPPTSLPHGPHTTGWWESGGGRGGGGDGGKKGGGGQQGQKGRRGHACRGRRGEGGMYAGTPLCASALTPRANLFVPETTATHKKQKKTRGATRGKGYQAASAARHRQCGTGWEAPPAASHVPTSSSMRRRRGRSRRNHGEGPPPNGWGRGHPAPGTAVAGRASLPPAAKLHGQPRPRADRATQGSRDRFAERRVGPLSRRQPRRSP